MFEEEDKPAGQQIGNATVYTGLQEDQDDRVQVPTAPGTAGAIPQNSTLAQAPTQRKAATGFVNLKKYIQANQGNKLADTVTNQAQSKLTAAGQNLNTAQQKFQSDIGTVKSKVQGAAGEAGRALNYVETGSQPLIQEQAPATFTGVKPTDRFAEGYEANLAAYNQQLADHQQQVDAYNKRANDAARQKMLDFRNLSYSGPQNLDNVQKLENDRAELQDFANATAKEAGRGAILQTLFGRNGQYSAGARNLDTMLLGADPTALTKFKDVRNQTANYEQQLKQAQQAALADVGATRGTINTEKAKTAQQMQQLRDALKAKLVAEATAYNTAQKADADEITIAELQKFLPEMAGYELTGEPRTPIHGFGGSARVGGQIRNPNMPGVDMNGITLPGESGGEMDPEKLKWVNLYRNKGFAPEDKIDPNEVLEKHVSTDGGLFQGDSHEVGLGRPNTSEVLVGIEGMKPLFNQSYTDNTWDSINKDTLNRRNLLSEVLADGAEDGVVLAKNKNELQTTMNDDLLTRLRQTPKMIRDNYKDNFLGGAPGTTAQQALEPGMMEQAGYKNPFEYMKDLGIDHKSSGGEFWTTGYNGNQAHWDSNMQMVEVPHFNGYTTHMTGEEFLKRFVAGPENQIGWDNERAPALVAERLKEKYVLDRLKALGFNDIKTRKT